MKLVLRAALWDVVPASITNREDKMGFPTQFNLWARGEARDFVRDIMTSDRALARDVVDNRRALERFDSESEFGRSFWGLFSLELWQQTFHDRESEFRWGTTVPAVIADAGPR